MYMIPFYLEPLSLFLSLIEFLDILSFIHTFKGLNRTFFVI